MLLQSFMKFCSASACGMLPMGFSRRRLLNQSIHSRVANSTALKVRHEPRRWMTSALNRPLMVSASALSQLSPTLQTDGSIPASARRSEYLIDRYRADQQPTNETVVLERKIVTIDSECPFRHARSDKT